MAVAGGILLDLLKINIRHLRLVSVDDLGQLLECRALGLDIHEIDECELETDPEGVNDVQSPRVVRAEGLEGDRVGVLVEQKCDLDRDVEDHQTLSTQLVREDLDCVADQETRPGDRVGDLEEPDEDDERLVGAG